MLQGFDYDSHNREVAELWSGYRKREPNRVPIIWGLNSHYTMLNDLANPRRITYEECFSDPATMLARLLEHQEYVRMNIVQDADMGVPVLGWDVRIDFQNTAEAAWFGCPVAYCARQVPATKPILFDDNKRQLFDSGIPDPFDAGLMRRNWAFYEYMLQAKHDGYIWAGRPLASVTPDGLATDGPLTVACNLRGTTSFFTDLLDDRDYALELLEFITTATIGRIRAYRKRLDMPTMVPNWCFADDSIQLISCQTYSELVYPFHKRLVDELSDGTSLRIHLCGDSSRHFAFMKEHLNVDSFDTGFPINYRGVREQLGPDVEILGGPTVPFLKSATPNEVRAEIKRILHSGVTQGKRFILREANNLAPDVPTENLIAMYEAGKEFGKYA